MKKLFLLLLAFVMIKGHFAQLNQSMNASEILQAMNKLNTLGSVLYVAAHPDDENTRLLAYLANEKKFRTGYLSITRGDGGQNLIGKEQGELLGLIRTQELLAARRTDGAEQFFTRANDFGYSKNPEETFSIWNKDSIMADVVFAIRKFRPDIIICRFPTTGEGGHGHHTASAMLAVEAFDLAADPTKFPEQLRYAGVWQAKRIFWNTFNFGTTNTTSPDQLKIDVGTYNPLLGKNYGEIASESRSMHKSQGFGSARQRGENIEFFKFLKGEKTETDVFQDVATGWDKLPSGTAIGRLLESVIANFQPSSPEKSLPGLTDIYRQISAMDEKDVNAAYWKKIKLKETEKLILGCSGLWLETFSSDYMAIPGTDMQLTTQVVNRNKNLVKLSGISYWKQTDTAMALELKANELYTFKHREKLAANTGFSNPYWLNEEHPVGTYIIRDRLLVGNPENTPVTKVYFKVNIAGLELEVPRDVVYKYTDPVKGEVYRPLEVLPPATVNISEKVFVFTDLTPRNIQLKIKANKAVNGTVQVKTNKGWTATLKTDHFSLAAKGDEVVLDVVLTPGRNAANGTLNVSLQIDGKVYEKSIQRIEYDHIPYQFFLTDAKAGIVHIDLKKTFTDIAYIPGAGDDVPAALKQIGYNVTILTDDLLSTADLSKYGAIVTGVRAYNTNERLSLMHDKLMEYVKKGGNLVVQYNTNSRVGPLQTKIGPYPFTISRDRVTNEQAEMRFRNAAHPVLNTPNKIVSADFEGWIQERGIYFATEVDSQYTSIFSINDPGEKASEGSLIIAPYGKGNFVYTGLAFFRELPAGVPGAYRLFVNILSLPQNTVAHE